MLIDFTVSNFRSIKEPQTLSMLATNDKELLDNTFVADDIDKTRLLKTAVIYGANGSGKSNLVLAFETMLKMVSSSSEFKVGEKIKAFQPFKLDNRVANDATEFSIEFLKRDIIGRPIRYKYGFSYNREEIIKEYLFFYPKKQEAKLFSREKDAPIEYGDSLVGNKKAIEKLLLPNQLFLSKSGSNYHPQLGDIYRFIYEIALIPIGLSNKDFISWAKEDLYFNSSALNLLKQLLKLSDTGVEDLFIKNSLHNREEYEVYTTHTIFGEQENKDKIIFSIEEESEGTQKLFGLGGKILSMMGWYDTIMVDELNNSFHPLITEMLIKVLHRSDINRSNMQLIFTTHDTSILRSDLFRRDQVWFAEKDTYGATSLYSLAEFDKSKVRANIPYDKWYLSGRFGALPLIKDMDFLKDDPKPETNAKAKKRK